MNGSLHALECLGRASGIGIGISENDQLTSVFGVNDSNPLWISEDLRKLLLDRCAAQTVPVIYRDQYGVIFAAIRDDGICYFFGPLPYKSLSPVELAAYFRHYGIRNGIALIAPLYYGLIILGDPAFYSTVNTVNIFPSVIGFLTVSFWIKRYGLTGTAKRAAVIGIAGCLIRTLVPMNSIVFLAANCLVMYATIPLISVLPAMTLNTAEANLQSSGVRITGMTNASNSFVGKLGGSVGGSLIGWVLGAGGFDAFNAGTIGVTEGLKQAVFTLNNYIPLAMFIIIFLLLFRYRYEEMLPDILKKNEEIEKSMVE